MKLKKQEEKTLRFKLDAWVTEHEGLIMFVRIQMQVQTVLGYSCNL